MDVPPRFVKGAMQKGDSHHFYTLDSVHILVYHRQWRMKKRELEKRLRELGWQFLKHGGKHDIWWNYKDCLEYIPRHKEIAEGLAKKIIKTAKGNPGDK